MLVRRMGISGFRSFAPAKSPLYELGPTTMLVGANNVGKSNYSIILVLIRTALAGANQAFEADHVEWSKRLEPLRRNTPLHVNDFWMREALEFTVTLDIEANVLPGSEALPGIVRPDGTVRAVFRAVRKGKSDHAALISLVPVLANESPAWNYDQKSNSILFFNPGTSEYITPDKNPAMAKFCLGVMATLETRILDIKAVRDLVRQGDSNNDTSTDGSAIINLFRGMRDKEPDRWTELCTSLEAWVTLLLGEKNSVRIEPTGNSLDIIFERTKSFRCDIKTLGTGVADIIIALGFLGARHIRGIPTIVTFDEPEAHLHPGAVARVIELATKEMPEHQLLLATHSTALVDSVIPDWKVFRVSRGTDGGTQLTPANTEFESLALLEELGIRASQLFLARGVLWVEGPSDVIYIRRMLRENPNTAMLVEHRDFSFLMYGGALISRLGIEDGPETITRLTRISNKFAVIGDLGASADARLAKHQERLEEESQRELKRSATIRPIGYEIEYLVRPDVLAEALESLLSKFSFSPQRPSIDKPFTQEYARIATHRDGTALSDAERKNLINRLQKMKPQIAERVCAQLTSPFLDSARALSDRVAELLG